jgi:hypothetical protein
LAQGGRGSTTAGRAGDGAPAGTTPRQPFAQRCPRLRRSAVPPQLWKMHAAFTRLYAGQGKADESERARRAALTSSRASGSAYRIPDSVRASQFSSDRHSPDDASLGWTGLMFASRGRQAKTSITDEDLGTTRLALGVTGRRPPRLHPGIIQEVAARASLPSLELKIGARAERPCARDASICRILQGDGDEVSNT